MTENEKIAALTSDAIRVSGKKVIDDIMATIEAAEQMAQTLRTEGEHLIADIRDRSDQFAERVSTYVTNCHTAMEAFQTHQTKIFETETQRPITKANPDLARLEKEITGV